MIALQLMGCAEWGKSENRDILPSAFRSVLLKDVIITVPETEEVLGLAAGIVMDKTLPAKSVSQEAGLPIRTDYDEEIETYGQLFDTTEHVVYVRHNNSLLGDGGGCIFEITDKTYGSVRRHDGSYVHAVPNQSRLARHRVPAIELGSCIASYVGRSSLKFGYNRGLFKVECEGEIDCSMFTAAIVQGVSYDGSRYVLGSERDNVYEEFARAISLPTIPGNDHMHSLRNVNMSEWFAQRKCLFSFESLEDWRDALELLQFGDILFATDVNTIKGSTHIYDIAHSMFFLRAFNDGRILMAQGGGAGGPSLFNQHRTPVKISILQFSDYYGQDNYFRVFARPNYRPNWSRGREHSELFVSTGEVSLADTPVHDIEGDAYLLAGALSFKEPLHRDRLYTLVLDGDFPYYKDDRCELYANATCDDCTEFSFTFYTDDCGNDVWLPFVVPADIGAGVIKLEIRIGVEEDSVVNARFRCTNASVIDGYAPDAAATRSLSFAKSVMQEPAAKSNSATVFDES